MNGEKSSDEAYKTRSALGDVTNQVTKRGFSLISTSGIKSGDDYKKDEGLRFGKKECRRVENFNKENFHKENVDCVLRPHLSSEVSALKGSAIARISTTPSEIKEPCSPDVRLNATSVDTVKSGDAVRDRRVFTQSMPINLSDINGPDARLETKEDERIDSKGVRENASKEKDEISGSMGNGTDVILEDLDSSKYDYLDCSRWPESQESRSCGIERCIGQKGDGCSSMDMDLMKACPCSFCMKAAYIWSDLHYQDIKGRIAALKKSQKEASILVQQNSRDSAVDGQGNLNKFSKLESDLTGQWRSLFLHMEDIFDREGSQLEGSLLRLKDLRDNCKTDLESTDKDRMSSEKQ